jgi:hypothetical protein
MHIVSRTAGSAFMSTSDSDPSGGLMGERCDCDGDGEGGDVDILWRRLV